MLSRERVLAALGFRPPDVVPLEYHSSPAGIAEHGNRLRELWNRYPGDFCDNATFPDVRPDPRFIDANGRYREVRRDEWGVAWEHLIFGVAGQPMARPLDNWANLDSYKPAPLPATSGERFEQERQRSLRTRERYFQKSGWISIFEVLHSVRRFEDALMEIATDAPEMNRLADLVVDYQLGMIEYLLARGVDAIQFGDDFGTQTGLMVSPATWRRFFKPRYERLMEPIRKAGKFIFFHTCGCNDKILEELASLGIDAIWPQLNAYDEDRLARFCRDCHVALEIHPDRGDLMGRGTPEQVRANVFHLAEKFRVAEGGAWFYVEIDSGFPFPNVEALIETIGKLRGV